MNFIQGLLLLNALHNSNSVGKQYIEEKNRTFRILEETSVKGPRVALSEPIIEDASLKHEKRMLDSYSIVGAYSDVLSVDNPNHEKMPELWPVWEFDSNSKVELIRDRLLEKGFQEVVVKEMECGGNKY